MAYSKDIIAIAHNHLSRCDSVTGVLLCCVIYGKWMDFRNELDFINECEKKIHSILVKKNKGV